MSEPSGTPQGRAPEVPGAIIPAGRVSPIAPEASDLFLADEFAPTTHAAQPGRAGAVSLRSLLRQKWLMLAVFILVAGASIPCVWLFTVPLYESTALVRVEPVVRKIVYTTENTGMLPLYREFMNTQVNVIRNPKVLERVLDRQDVQETRWYREAGKRLLRNPLPPIERLTKALQVQTRRDTQFISVSMSTEKGSEAKLIVDAVVDEYFKLVKEQERLAGLELIGEVRRQHTALDTEVKGLRDLRRSLSKDSGLMDSMELRAQLSTKLNDLESRYMEVDRSLSLLKSRLERTTAQATQPAEADEAAPAEAGPDYAEDPEWRNLSLALKNARHGLDLARDQYGESHPKIRQLTSNVSHAEMLLADRQDELDQERERGSGIQLQTSLSDNEAASIDPDAIKQQMLPEKELEKDLLQKDIEKLRAKVTDIQAIASNEEQLRGKEQVLAEVRNRLTTLEMESNAQGRITIDAHGLSPSEPDRDRRPLLSVMALGAAGMLALALAYLRCMSDSRIHEVDDIQTMTRAPFLGRLPALAKAVIPRELGGVSDESLLVRGSGEVGQGSYPDPSGPTALLEGVRIIRTALLERLGSTMERAILITSPTSRAGKTSLALLLGRSLAATGKTVLLVEGDFYRPSLAGRLGLKATAGLAAVLVRAVDDAGAVQPSSVPLLDVLPVGDIPDAFNPEVLANGVFAECMLRWRRKYDYIILDSPPVLPVADARILASHVDGALLVLKASHNRRTEAWSAFTQLSATRGGVLGVVMIGGEAHSGSYHYGYSDYPYSVARAVASPSPDPADEKPSITGT